MLGGSELHEHTCLFGRGWGITTITTMTTTLCDALYCRQRLLLDIRHQHQHQHQHQHHHQLASWTHHINQPLTITKLTHQDHTWSYSLQRHLPSIQPMSLLKQQKPGVWIDCPRICLICTSLLVHCISRIINHFQSINQLIKYSLMSMEPSWDCEILHRLTMLYVKKIQHCISIHE